MGASLSPTVGRASPADPPQMAAYGPSAEETSIKLATCRRSHESVAGELRSAASRQPDRRRPVPSIRSVEESGRPDLNTVGSSERLLRPPEPLPSGLPDRRSVRYSSFEHRSRPSWNPGDPNRIGERRAHVGVSLSQDEVDAVKAGKFELRAPHMELVLRGDPARRFSGGGWLRQDEGRLSYELYSSTDSVTLDQFMAPLMEAPGSWTRHSQLYDLTLQDTSGRTWTAEKTRVQTDAINNQSGAIAHGTVRQVECSSRAEQPMNGARMWLYFPGRLRLPATHRTTTQITVAEDQPLVGWTFNVWLVEDADRRFRFTRHEEGVELVVECGNPLEPGFDTRIEEALWLVLGRHAQWGALHIASGGHQRATIRPRPSPPPNRAREPLELDDPDHAPDIAELFLKYLDSASREGRSGAYAPASAQLLRVVRASAGNVDEQVVALVLAIEDLARRYFSDFGTPPESERDAISSLQEHVNDWGGELRSKEIDVRDRVIKFLDGWKGSNARQVLLALQERGVITAEQRLTWEGLRHKAAHGSFVSGTTIETLRAASEHCDHLHQLLLRLIFTMIGYRRRFTDRTEVAWPTKTFDLPGWGEETT